MRSIGFQNFQQCCFRLPDWWSNSTHWMGRLFLAIFFWRHNEPDGVSNHQSHDCLLNCLFRRRSKKTSKLRVTGLCEGNLPMTGEFPHKGPVTRKMFPFDDVIIWLFTLIPFASCFLLPVLPLNYALSCSENGLVPQERIITIFSQNKPIFKQKMSLKMVSAKYRPFVGTGATYTITLEICTQIGCALFCRGHNIIDSWHTFYWLGLQWDLTHWSLGDLNKEIKKQFFTSFSDWWLGIQCMSLDFTDYK